MKNMSSEDSNVILSTNYKIHKCTICNRIFNKKNSYLNHFLQHQKNDNAYACNICGKSFAVPARLTRHFRTHTGEKPFQCEFCKKSFSVKENLSVHRRIHTKERPYQCNICSKAFEHSGKLHRHMRIHTGERPHKCMFCSKTFIQSGQLVIHMRTHTGEKPYICKSCGKGFTCSKQLKVHSRTHTGEKPYKCNICFKSFGYNHVLKLHQASHYGEKFFRCVLCQETFNSKKLMEMHVKGHSSWTVNHFQVINELPIKSNNRINNINNNLLRLKNDEESISAKYVETVEKVEKANSYTLEIVHNKSTTTTDQTTLENDNMNKRNLNKTSIKHTQNYLIESEISTNCNMSDSCMYLKEDLNSEKHELKSYIQCNTTENNIECINNFNQTATSLENDQAKAHKITTVMYNTASGTSLGFNNSDIVITQNSSNLPPRKRCKFLDLMDTESIEKIRMRRCNSVIKYAKGNGLQ